MKSGLSGSVVKRKARSVFRVWERKRTRHSGGIQAVQYGCKSRVRGPVLELEVGPEGSSPRLWKATLGSLDFVLRVRGAPEE